MPDSLTVQLANQTTSHHVFAFITGLALQHNMARVFITADGRGLYFPEAPPAGRILQPLTQDCAIPLGAPGTTVAVTIPQLAGGRIWFSAERPLTFLRNPGGPGGGAALVEPSVLNPTDPNADADFSFCELTLNRDQLFANISYVDFVPRMPLALTLRVRGTGEVQHVSGMPPDGLDRVCAALREQAARDGRPWDKLVVQPRGHDRPLRALSPTHGNAVGASFDGYFEPLVEEAWSMYRAGHHHQDNQQQQQQQQGGKAHRKLLSLFKRSSAAGPPKPPPRAVLRINTQAAAGVVEGGVCERSGELVLGGEGFKRPTTADILGCNSGPFATGPSATRNAIIPRLAAAFQRGCICDVREHPSHPETFYRRDPTNHYSRIVHECNLDGKGYAFAYDDVQPDGGADQSGKVNAGDPEVLIVAVGGSGAYAGDRMS